MSETPTIRIAEPGEFTVNVESPFASNWHTYDVDFEKVKTLDDVIALLRGIQITITLQNPVEDRWQPILPYLKERSTSAGGSHK